MKLRALFFTVALTACGAVLPQQHAPSFDLAAAARHGVSCRGAAPKAADPKAVHGLMVWIDSTHLTAVDPAIVQYLPYDPKLCGASIDFLWSGIDKGPAAAPHQYRWKVVEEAIAPWAAAGKRANLLFIGADEAGTADRATPSYVLMGPSAVPTVPACTNPGPGTNAGPPTPVYWNARYERPWRAFIAAVIEKYGRDSRIGYMRFGLGAGAEDFPQHGADGNCFANWQKHGLSGARFWATFSAKLTRYIGRTSAANHATVQQIVALNPFASASPYPVAKVVAAAAAAVGVGIGTENLGSGNYGSTPKPCTNAQYWCGAFEAGAGTVPEEFQPIQFTLDTNTHVAPLTSLLPYGMLNHAQIFELYPQEWLTADDPNFPTYCQYHRAWQKTLSQAADILGRSGTQPSSPSPRPSQCPATSRALPANLRAITYDATAIPWES